MREFCHRISNIHGEQTPYCQSGVESVKEVPNPICNRFWTMWQKSQCRRPITFKPYCMHHNSILSMLIPFFAALDGSLWISFLYYYYHSGIHGRRFYAFPAMATCRPTTQHRLCIDFYAPHFWAGPTTVTFPVLFSHEWRVPKVEKSATEFPWVATRYNTLSRKIVAKDCLIC